MKTLKYHLFKWLWPEIEKNYSQKWKEYENQIENYKERLKYTEWEVWKLKNENNRH